LEGCRQWLENGLGIPGEVIAATNNYQEDQNPFTDFFADEGIQIDSDHVVPVSDLWERYNQYCRSTGERPLFRKKTTFREALRERGVEPRRSGRDGSWRIHGLGLPQSNPRGSRVDDQWAASL
jgi:putative DNA primase/helicase